MRPRRVPLIVSALTVLAVLLGVYLARTSPSAVAAREREARRREALQPVASPRSEAPAGALEIETRTVLLRPLALRAEISAVLQPLRKVTVAAEVEGVIVEVAAEEHSYVEAGAAIVQVERSLLKAAADRAEAARQRAAANYRLARLESERQQSLRERNATSAAELDRATSTARARLADLREAEAALDDAKVRLDKATIRAPFAGVVNVLDLELGAYLRPGDTVAEILDLSEIEVEVGVTDRQIVALRSGDPVTVAIDVFPREPFAGVITSLGRAAHDQTRKYPVLVRVPNDDGRLLPGMLGRVRFDLGEREPTIRVPRAATLKEFELAYVFVVSGREAPIVERRRVTTRPVPFRPDLLEVVDGLREGERIATSRIRELRDGQPIREKGSDS